MAQVLLHRASRAPVRGQVDVVKILTEIQKIHDDIAKFFVEHSKKNVLQTFLLVCLRSLRTVMEELGRVCQNHQRQIKRSSKRPSKTQQYVTTQSETGM